MKRAAEGLFQKIYVLSQDGVTVGGVYLWNSRPEAEAMYTESWRSFVREKYGTDPAVTHVESPVVDNVAQQVLTDESESTVLQLRASFGNIAPSVMRRHLWNVDRTFDGGTS